MVPLFFGHNYCSSPNLENTKKGGVKKQCEAWLEQKLAFATPCQTKALIQKGSPFISLPHYQGAKSAVLPL